MSGAGPAFFQTRMGARFYEVDVPAIAKALTTIAKHDRAARVSSMAATIAAGLCSRGISGPFNPDEVAEKALEVALEIEKLVNRLPKEEAP